MKTVITTIIIALSAIFSFKNNSFEAANFAQNYEAISAANLQINTNDLNNEFTISENEFVKEVVVFNLIGKEVKRFSVENNESYNLKSLPDGIYLISLMTENEQVIKTIRLGKRNFVRA